MQTPHKSQNKMDTATGMNGHCAAPHAAVSNELQIKRDMRMVRAKLRELVTEREVRRWLLVPNANQNGLTPADAVAHGKTERVLEMLAAIEYGIHV